MARKKDQNKTETDIQTLRLTTVGSSTGAVIPKDMLAQLRVEKGDILYAIETAGGFYITPFDPAIEGQLVAGADILGQLRESFKALGDEEGGNDADEKLATL